MVSIRNISFVLAVFCLAFAIDAVADEVDCGDAQDQFSMNLCFEQEYIKYKKEKIEVYNKLSSKVSSAGKSKLNAARSAWEKYMKLQCKFELGGGGGSADSMILSICYSGLTQEYIERLKVQLDCEEGVINCGGQ